MSWRNTIKIHPAADLLPLMGPDELRILGADIKRYGLKSRIVLWVPGWGEPSEAVLVDGRNRLDAMEAAGLTPRFVLRGIHWYIDGLEGMAVPDGPLTFWSGSDLCDPYDLALSLNVHRRHLTTEQKHELIAKLLKVQPDKSDRQIAATIKVDHKTVAKVRAAKEARGEIPHVKKRIDTKGRKQSARKSKPVFAKVGNEVDPEISAPRKAEISKVDVCERQALCGTLSLIQNYGGQTRKQLGLWSLKLQPADWKRLREVLERVIADFKRIEPMPLRSDVTLSPLGREHESKYCP
jgi:hypothetical protein